MWDTARSMMLDLAFDSVRKMRLCQVDRYKTPLEAQLHKSLLRVKLGRRCRPSVVKDGRRKKTSSTRTSHLPTPVDHHVNYYIKYLFIYMYDLRAAKIRQILFIYLSFLPRLLVQCTPRPFNTAPPPQPLLLYQPSTSVNAVYYVDGGYIYVCVTMCPLHPCQKSLYHCDMVSPCLSVENMREIQVFPSCFQ
jgi:hypothetical protein